MYSVCSKYHNCQNKECLECEDYIWKLTGTYSCGCNRERLLELLDCVENFALKIDEDNHELCEELL